MQSTTHVRRVFAWIRDLLTDPAHDPRPTPTTGEAWLVAGTADIRPTVSYVENPRVDVKLLAHC